MIESWSNLKNRTQEIAILTWSNLLQWNSPLPGRAHFHNFACVAVPCTAQWKREGSLGICGQDFFSLPSYWDDYWKSQRGQKQIGFSLFFILHLTAGYEEKPGTHKAYFRCCWREGKEEGETTANEQTRWTKQKKTKLNWSQISRGKLAFGFNYLHNSGNSRVVAWISG